MLGFALATTSEMQHKDRTRPAATLSDMFAIHIVLHIISKMFKKSRVPATTKGIDVSTLPVGGSVLARVCLRVFRAGSGAAQIKDYNKFARSHAKDPCLLVKILTFSNNF
jgi:hypothetical protein